MQNPKFPCGLVSISFRPYSVRQILDAVKESGLDSVEWGSDVHAPSDDPERLEEIVALQEEYGIRCSSYGTYFRLGVDPIEDLDAHITAARALGCNVLRLWCGHKKMNYQDYSKEQKEALLDAARQVAALGEEEDVIFCMECHQNTFTNCLEGALALMEATASDHFRMYWQPNEHVDYETNLRYAKEIAPYTKVIHVFNWEGRNRYPLRDATDRWLSYLAFFDGSQRLLLEHMPDDRLETLATEAEALKEIRECLFKEGRE